MALSPVLSKERPDHPSLDYEVLRTEGIRHLENLATEIWTDFNAHDPGITMLELLSYAITDLGYRTRRLPIADLVAGGREKSFFEPLEILPCAPVTAADYRKILIDLEGVKNAWVKPYDQAALFTDKEVAYGLFPADQLVLKNITDEQIEALVKEHNQKHAIDVTVAQAKKWIETWQRGILETTCVQMGVDPALFFDPCLGPEKCPVPPLARPPATDPQCTFLFTLLCHYGYWSLGLANVVHRGNSGIAPIQLNGLMHITLDLDDAIDPENENETRPILDRVMKRLQANRFLGQDYVKPFTLVKKLPIAICLHLEVANGKNILNAATEALWRIEQHLTPTLRFYTFQEMLDKGYAIDEIYNGPLLDHGFLDDQDLEKAQLLREFRHSDLTNAATVDPDVLTVHELKLKVFPDQEFSLKTSYTIFTPDSALDQDKEKNPTKLSAPLKPIIDICKSCIYVTQNGVRCELEEAALAEALQLKRLLAECHDTPGGPKSPIGNYRPDLTEYRSLQYDLPGIYGVGDYNSSTGVPAAKRGKRKQLQAYLAFFDQMLAAYLNQLGAVRRLLSVQQDPSQATYQSANLMPIPGMTEIIDPKKSFNLESQATQQDRSNRLLGHLLARFAETFSEYTANLASSCKTPGNGYYESYGTYLSAKAAFLQEVPDLGFSRGLAYDYSGGKDKKVWNSLNVPGVKKRVHRLLGLKGSWRQQSLLISPAYRLDIAQVMSQKKTRQYQIVFKTLEENLPTELPYKGVLLRSPRYASLKQAQEKRDELYSSIWDSALFQVDQHPRETSQQAVIFSPEGKMELISDPLSESESKNLQLFIQELVAFEPHADKEGFHVLEHILLRPNDLDDHLLTLSLGAKPQYTPKDPYSNWLTIIVPNWTEKFKEKSFQQHFEQSFRREAPAEMALRFCWLDKETMREFEERFKAWLEAKANCSPNECHITETANALIDWLNKTPCSCSCQHCCSEEQACQECRDCNNEQ